jgi:uncharacterized membrane protein YdjX (TVP38/TMEM64 family)
MNSQKIKIAIAVMAVLVVTIFLIKMSANLDAEAVKEFIRSFGILGPLVFIFINAVTIIFSPLTSFPLWLASLSIYGFWPTLIYVYIGNNLGNLAAFIIAKHFGRPLIARFVGENNIKKVDEFVDLVGVKPLFVARLVGGAGSDYISYAAGLTKIKARTYLTINLAAMGPSIFIQLLILEKTITVNPIYLLIFIIWGYVAAFAFTIYLYRKKKREKLI